MPLFREKRGNLGSAESKGVSSRIRPNWSANFTSQGSMKDSTLSSTLSLRNHVERIRRRYVLQKKELAEGGLTQKLTKRRALIRQRLVGLEVLGFKSGMFGDSGEHFRANFDGVVERPGVFALDGMAQLSVRAA